MGRRFAVVHGCKGIGCRNSGVTAEGKGRLPADSECGGGDRPPTRINTRRNRNHRPTERDGENERERERERRTMCPGDERREREERWKASGIKRWSRRVTIGEAGEGGRSNGKGVRYGGADSSRFSFMHGGFSFDRAEFRISTARIFADDLLWFASRLLAFVKERA